MNGQMGDSGQMAALFHQWLNQSLDETTTQPINQPTNPLDIPLMHIHNLLSAMRRNLAFLLLKAPILVVLNLELMN